MAALAAPAAQAAVGSRSVEIHPEFTLAFVEFDDQGRFWDRSQLELLERTLEAENRRPDTSGVTISVFAHGWRHDAEVCDANVACFRTFLAQLHADMGVVTRVAGGNVRPKRLVAVYVSWRGLSARVWPFEQLSFWARNAVAHRIADGDLVELLTRIELFAHRANTSDRNRVRLAVIGHSLGGTMIYSALANILKMRALEAAERQNAADPRESLIAGFGDLVVLVNPALEASRYAPLHEIAARFRRFSPLQGPVLITIASETDGPNGVWFPLGRRIETLFQRTGDRSPRSQIVTALGNFAAFWTHRLTAAVKPPARRLEDTFGEIRRGCACGLPLEAIDDREASYLISLLLGRPPSAGGEPAVYGRTRLTALKPIDPHNPFWVVRASDDVVHGHSGIFTTYLLDFVRRVIIEASSRAPSGS